MITITSPITGATVTMDETKARAGLERARKEIAHLERLIATDTHTLNAAARAKEIEISTAKLAQFRATEQAFASALGA